MKSLIPNLNGKHIHLIAICGTAMGSLAGLLVEAGYEVTGSDQNVYPPMSTQLENLGIKIFEGYKPENLACRPDLVIIGNAVSKTNPEVVEVLDKNISYLSLPQALSQFFIEGKESIVITGTHGKTTTTALMTHCLKELNADPSYLIGGVLQDGEKNYHLSSGKYFVIEGDEYDTAFFDKGPKFLHYQPYHTVITSLEFDHADIYRDMDHLTESFRKLISIINPKGNITACSEYDSILSLLEKTSLDVTYYGLTPKNKKPFLQATNISFEKGLTHFDILNNGVSEASIQMSLAGKHNILNALAVYSVLKKCGFKSKEIASSINSFSGVKRRQEVRGTVNDIIVIDDFAHHPTAVLETIDAIKNKYPGYQLWAIFEPRSNSSKRNIFQQDYPKAFLKADFSILASVFMPEKVPDGKVLNVEQIIQDIQSQGKKAVTLPDVDSILNTIVQTVQPKTVLLMMSNGGFGGIHQKTLDALRKKFEINSKH